jgi:hypothetical protein
MWYYTAQKLALSTPPLNSRFDQVHTDSMWMDNPDGYRLCSVIQEDLDWDVRGAWWERFDTLGTKVYSRDSLNFLAFRYAVVMTKKPQYVSIRRVGGGHALILYGAESDSLLIADPNYPGISRSIKMKDGSFVPYTTMQKVGVATHEYPRIRYYAKTSMINYQAIADRWRQFELGTIGTVAPHAFPEVELFLLTPTGEQPLTESIQTPLDTISIIARCANCAAGWQQQSAFIFVHDEQGRFLTHSADHPDGVLRIPVQPGTHRYGLRFDGWHAINVPPEYITFAWLEVEKVIVGNLAWRVRAKCVGQENWGLLGQSGVGVELIGRWEGDTYVDRRSWVDLGYLREIDLNVKIDTLTGALLSYSQSYTITGPQIDHMYIHIEGRDLPTLSLDSDYYRYRSEGPSTCDYIDDVVGRNVVMCGDVEQWDCENYGSSSEPTYVNIVLPARPKK